MPVIHPTLPADGDEAVVEPYNAAINAILGVLNGDIDSDNIASVDGSKIIAGSIPQSALSNAAGGGWTPTGFTPNTVAYNGNHSYTLTFNGHDLTNILSPGDRLQLGRTVTAPTQCASLNGSGQYFSKSSPAGMTFTDDFVVSAWIKLSAYGSTNGIVSRYNGTSGWLFFIAADGTLLLRGQNAGSGNFSGVHSCQSVPLNKWVHISAQLDMSSFSASPTTSYMTMDGVDIPCFVERANSNPTALIQAGNLEVGSFNAGNTFNGEIAQVAIYSAKVTEATIAASINQTLAGSESSLISAYSFNNTINDLNTSNANNLTANGSAVATTVDNPFADTLGITSYGIIMTTAFSTNTTLVVQVASHMTLPTSGGINLTNYSGLKIPYKFPAQKEKWTVLMTSFPQYNVSSATANQFYNVGNLLLNVPIGYWNLSYTATVQSTRGSGGTDVYSGLGTSTSTTDPDFLSGAESGATPVTVTTQRSKNLFLSVATPYYLNHVTTYASNSNITVFTASTIRGNTFIEAICSLL